MTNSGNERDPHAPSGMDAEHPPELHERQLLVVDMDDDFAVRPVVYDAAEHVAARHPLIAVLVIVDLLLAWTLFDDRLVHASRSSH